MSFSDSVRSCLSKYVTFSGRARRSEYWWFALFVFLGLIVLAVLDGLVFGIDETTGETRRVLTALFQLGTLLPFLAVGWRRMHDTGRPGWYLFLPMAVSLATLFMLMSGVLVFSMAQNAGASADTLRGPAAVLGWTGLMIAWLVQLVLAVLIIWWLTRPSDPAANEYGEPV